MKTIQAGLTYFALVFGTGFVLGPISILWLVPRVDTRAAELMETPIVLVVTIVAARWTVRRFAVGPEFSSRLGIGLLALSLLSIAEFTLVFGLSHLRVEPSMDSRGRSIS
ncbi:MAG TPA: hypothetical protein VFV34_08380 [Blastocatellia bacterium]|nr:hypothetical protein [Blastocatellia bacterium]